MGSEKNTKTPSPTSHFLPRLNPSSSFPTPFTQSPLCWVVQGRGRWGVAQSVTVPFWHSFPLILCPLQMGPPCAVVSSGNMYIFQPVFLYGLQRIFCSITWSTSTASYLSHLSPRSVVCHTFFAFFSLSARPLLFLKHNVPSGVTILNDGLRHALEWVHSTWLEQAGISTEQPQCLLAEVPNPPT